MVGEKENREYYKNTFDEVHASDHLLRKVEAMGKEYNEKKVRRILYKGCITAAVLAIALVSSNIITYAATGRPWIITVTTSDGRELPAEPGTYELEDGTVYTYKYVLEEQTKEPNTEESSTDTAETESEAFSENMVDLLEESRAGEEEIQGTDLSDTCRTVREEDHLFLDINGVFRIDITDALTSESHEGIFEVNGKRYQYKVGGTLEDNTLRVNAQE